MRAVLFDLDDTLVPDSALMRRALLAACAAVVPAGSPEALAAAVRGAARRLWRASQTYQIGRRLGLGSSQLLSTDDLALRGQAPEAAVSAATAVAADTRNLRLLAWRRALLEVGADPALAGPLDARFRRERLRGCAPLPGTAAALARLRRFYRIAIVTNGPSSVQRAKVAAAGLGPLVDAVIVSSEVGAAKPDARPFETALRLLSVAPVAACMVGDSVERDVVGARAAGLHAILVAGEATAAEAGAGQVVTIASIAGLEAALRRIPFASG